MTYGIRKTNVEDLTSAAGISKGAFYLFFDSKEALFFEILGQFETEYQQQMLDIAAQPGEAPRASVKNFLLQAFSIWRTHPLFMHFDQEEYEYLLRKLPDLPPELEYRIVGRHLILRDVKANLIVDVLRDVVPTIPT